MLPTDHLSRFCRALKWLTSIVLVCSLNLSATTVIPPDLTQLVKESDYIVRAVVTSVTTKEKTNPGKRTLIYSDVELDIREVIVGTPPDPCILEVLGGNFHGREMHISGAPTFTVGEEAIFFVQGNRTQIFPLTRMMHGLYPILKEKGTGHEYIARSDGEEMTDVQQISEPIHGHGEKTLAHAKSAVAQTALSPEQFVAQIRSTAKALQTNEK